MDHLDGTSSIRVAGERVVGTSLEGLIRSLRRQRGLRAALELADLLMRAWNPSGTGMSLRQFAARDDVPLSLSTLSRLIAMHGLAERLELVRKAQHLKPGHLRAVLVLSQSQQDELLSAAERERWTVAKTQGRARKLVRRAPRGRRQLPRFFKSIHALARVAGDPEAWDGIDAAPELDRATLEDLAHAAEHVRGQCERAAALLRQAAADRPPGRGSDLGAHEVCPSLRTG